jgi:hypothetical protein
MISLSGGNGGNCSQQITIATDGWSTERKAETCPLVQVRPTYQSLILALCGEKMGIATDILNLRHNKLSSVTMLISALERFNNSPHERALNRLFQVDEAADLVLTNVAAHAAEALVAQRPTKGTTQRVMSMRRTNRRFKSGHQRSASCLLSDPLRKRGDTGR